MVEVRALVPNCETDSVGAENATLRRLSTALPASAVWAAARIIFQNTSDDDLIFFQKHATSLGMMPIADLIAIEAQRRAGMGLR